MQLDIKDLEKVKDAFFKSHYLGYEESKYLLEIVSYLIERSKFQVAYIEIKELDKFTSIKLNKG